MPFTAAHPAIILPLLKNRRWFSATGLIMGSLAPDFDYFLLWPFFSTSGHTLAGLLLFDLPVAFVLASIFQLLVRRPVVAHLPGWLQQRALAVPVLQWPAYIKARWLTFTVSVVIGASSHIFWDSFTHISGYFVQQLPVLSQMVLVGGEEVMVCRFLQHGSTLLGSLAILRYTWRLKTIPATGGVETSAKAWFWAGIGAAGLGFMAFALSISPIPTSLMGIVVTFITGCMLATMAASLSVQVAWRRERT
ncbi:DUF4184 family protein [Pontibacter sp. HJ8]